MTASLALSLPAELSESDRAALADIAIVARHHSHQCRESYRELVAAMKLDPEHDFWIDNLTAYEHAMANLWSTIAPAAMLRAAIIGPLDEQTGQLLDMKGDELERFLRPIFVEAGIVEDFAP